MIDFLVQNSGIIGLMAFFGFFAVMIARIFRPGAKQVYDGFANIPFVENDHDR